MSTPDAKLQRLLGGPALKPLRQRLRRHFERLEHEDARQFLSLGQLNRTEHEALALLTGRPPGNARSLRIDIADINAMLQEAGICRSLREALERLDGPITNRVAARTAAEQAWATLMEHEDRETHLRDWLQTPDARSLLRRLARQDPTAAHNLLAQANTVLSRLPADGLPRAQLAAQALGDAHALDAGRAVATIVLAVWRHREACTAQSSRSDAPATMAQEHARETWARAGILVNELARPALFLNLPIADPTTATWRPGEPSYLSLRQLLRTLPPWSVAGIPVFVCENPNLLAIAADQLGVRCAPLVCTDGMPAAAQRTILNQLRQAGAELHYHGDFDWPGLQIANHVIRSWQAAPWRLSTNDYEAAVQTAQHTRHARHELAASDVVATWDTLLAPAMRRYGLAIAEEAVAEPLLDDLGVHD